jgi:succinylarginine dihydrolase
MTAPSDGLKSGLAAFSTHRTTLLVFGFHQIVENVSGFEVLFCSQSPDEDSRQMLKSRRKTSEIAVPKRRISCQDQKKIYMISEVVVFRESRPTAKPTQKIMRDDNAVRRVKVRFGCFLNSPDDSSGIRFSSNCGECGWF